MVSLDDKVRALAVTAGWKSPRPGQDGSYSFRLEDGLDLKVFSPDGRLCFLLADLHALPEPGHGRDSLLRKVAGRQAGLRTMRTRPPEEQLRRACGFVWGMGRQAPYCR